MSTLKIGQEAPDINLPNQDGKIIKLDNFKGKKVIVYFYPKDNTPGCTAEACGLRDSYTSLLSKGFEVVGISADSIDSHKKFSAKNNLPFTLLSDSSLSVIKAYGAWGEKLRCGKKCEGIIRKTFVISENGTIEHVIDKVDTKNPASQILELYK